MVRTPSFDKNGIKKGAWSPEEDTKLEAYIRRYGHWNWRELPKFAGLQRCGKSCRLRWMNYLRPNVKRGNFTEAEDDLILELHAEHGNKWSTIATRLQGRTDNEIKNHWHTHLKKRRGAHNSSPDSSHVSLSGADSSGRSQKQVSSGGSSSTLNPAVLAEDCFQNIPILESCPLPPQPSSVAISSSSGTTPSSGTSSTRGNGVLFGETVRNPPVRWGVDSISISDLIDHAINSMCGSSTCNSSGELMAVEDGGMTEIYRELDGVGDEFWTKPFDVEEMSFYDSTSSFNTSENDDLLWSSYMTHYDQTMVDLFFDQPIMHEVYP